MCIDCQCYLHWLERGDDLLDENGGSRIFQLAPAQVQISHGREHLRCMRLSPKGLMRWYAGCCNTPVGNTMTSAKTPFFGMLVAFMDFDGRTPDEVLGPVLVRAMARWGKGTLPADAHPSAPLWFILRSLRLFAGAWIRRAHAPSPVFDLSTGQPAVEPTVISRDDRERLRAACAGSAGEEAA